MKTAKLWTIWAGFLCIFVNLLIVPWQFVCKATGNFNATRDAGYAFIGTPPVSELSPNVWSTQMDLNRLIVQSIAIVILLLAIFGTLYLTSKKRSV
jgi:hypothetical protein